MEKVTNWKAMEKIGMELSTRLADESLDFTAFRSLFSQAVEACGAETDTLEMFYSVAKDPVWLEWLRQQLANLPARSVA